jgi:hypothetical protein
VTDRVASATAALDRLTAVCHPVTRDGAAPQDPALLLTSDRSIARAAEPRDVVVRNALGMQSLTLVGRRAVCLPAGDVAASD